jgi:hypothetical protein
MSYSAWQRGYEARYDTMPLWWWQEAVRREQYEKEARIDGEEEEGKEAGVLDECG